MLKIKQLDNTTATEGATIIYTSGTNIWSSDVSGALQLPVGDTSDRPTPAEAGMIRFNSDLGTVEYFDGVQWTSPVTSTFSLVSGTWYGYVRTDSAGLVVSGSPHDFRIDGSYGFTPSNYIEINTNPSATGTYFSKSITVGLSNHLESYNRASIGSNFFSRFERTYSTPGGHSYSEKITTAEYGLGYVTVESFVDGDIGFSILASSTRIQAGSTNYLSIDKNGIVELHSNNMSTVMNIYSLFGNNFISQSLDNNTHTMTFRNASPFMEFSSNDFPPVKTTLKRDTLTVPGTDTTNFVRTEMRLNTQTTNNAYGEVIYTDPSKFETRYILERNTLPTWVALTYTRDESSNSDFMVLGGSPIGAGNRAGVHIAYSSSNSNNYLFFYPKDFSTENGFYLGIHPDGDRFDIGLVSGFPSPISVLASGTPFAVPSIIIQERYHLPPTGGTDDDVLTYYSATPYGLTRFTPRNPLALLDGPVIPLSSIPQTMNILPSHVMIQDTPYYNIDTTNDLVTLLEPGYYEIELHGEISVDLVAPVSGDTYHRLFIELFSPSTSTTLERWVFPFIVTNTHASTIPNLSFLRESNSFGTILKVDVGTTLDFVVRGETANGISGVVNNIKMICNLVRRL